MGYVTAPRAGPAFVRKTRDVVDPGDDGTAVMEGRQEEGRLEALVRGSKSGEKDQDGGKK